MSTIFDCTMEVINDNFEQLYKFDNHIISIFVVGSMAIRPYKERKFNDYDIRCVVDEYTPQTFYNIEHTVKRCLDCFKNSTQIGLASSDLVGPVNHHVTNKEHNVLIHYMVHTINDLVGFLPSTHKYMYGNHHLQICGRDVLSELKLADARYSLKDLVEGYEGIDYCVRMIENHTHRYCRYEVIDGKCVFVSREVNADIYVQHENCFYATLKNIGNLRNYDYFTGLETNSSLYEYGMRILSEVGYTDFRLLDILLRKDEASLDEEYPLFGEATLVLLDYLRKYVVGRINLD